MKKQNIIIVFSITSIFLHASFSRAEVQPVQTLSSDKEVTELATLPPRAISYESAFVLPKGATRIGLIDFTTGLGRHWELSTIILPNLLGSVNVGGAYNFLNTENLAFKASLHHILRVNTDVYQGNLVPGLKNTYQIFPFLHHHLGVAYNYHISETDKNNAELSSVWEWRFFKENRYTRSLKLALLGKHSFQENTSELGTISLMHSWAWNKFHLEAGAFYDEDKTFFDSPLFPILNFYWTL